MQASDEQRATREFRAPNDDDASEIEVLRCALMSMGLDILDPDDIAPEFRDPIIRLAASWKAAISEATLSSRRSDLRRFTRWCLRRSEAPFQSDAELADLMERHLSDAGQRFAPGTVKRMGSNLAALARGVGSDSAANSAQDCRIQAARAAQKLERIRGVQRQKSHLTVPQMQRLREAIAAKTSASTLAIRDLAIFDVACDLLASRSEIIKLRMRDLDLPAGTVRFSTARGDQDDRGSIFAIAPRTGMSIKAWLEVSGLYDLDVEDFGNPPVFVGVMNDGKIRLGSDSIPEPMDGRTVARALQRYATPLGISGVAGHSLRRSMARALYEAGVAEEEIVRKGRWSSLVQMREYVGLIAPIQGASALVF